MSETHHGGCLCGAVRYTISAPLRDVVACHCSQCRRTSGHFVAATSAPAAALTFESDAGLAWYRSSDTAQRGFCRVCGGNLFWRQLGSGDISVMAGTLDAPTGLSVSKHIFVADKSDYYSLDDAVPQLQGWT